MNYPVFYVPAGDVLPVLFSSYAGSTGASLTLTGLAVTDIEIYKDGSTTQRASDAGYTLLDTDGIDFDGITGIHGFSIDTGDNTDAGFYTVGAWFTVVVSSVTVDSQTVNFIACQFRLMPAESVAGKPKVDTDTFGGTAGTFSGGRAEVNTSHIAGSAVSTSSAQIGVNVVNAGGTAWGSGAITAASIAADAITAAKVATGAIDADALAADAVTEIWAGSTAPSAATIADAVWDEATAGHTTAGTTGKAIIDAGSAGDPWSTALPGAYGAGSAGKILGDNLNATITSRASQTALDTVDDFIDTEVTAIKAKTDQLAFTGGNVAANVLAINGSTAAAQVSAILNGSTVVYQGTVTGAATTTTLIDSGLTQADADWWKGRIIIFTSVIPLQATDITAFDPATDKLTFTATTQAPTGATYVII